MTLVTSVKRPLIRPGQIRLLDHRVPSFISTSPCFKDRRVPKNYGEIEFLVQDLDTGAADRL